MIDECTALILAGGASRRMGRDKMRIELHELEGKTLLQGCIDVMQPLFPRVLVSVAEFRDDIEVPQVCDEVALQGPLAGVCAGMKAITTPWVFVVAGDMPFLNPALIERLASFRGQGDAVVPLIDGFPQTLTAFYSCSTLPTFQSVFAGVGKHSFRAALERLSVCYVDEKSLISVDADLRSFVDIDTPDDLLRVRHSPS